MRDDQRRADRPHLGFLPPFGCRHSLLGHPVPPVELVHRYLRLTATLHGMADPEDGGVHTAAHNPWPPPAAFQRPAPITLAPLTAPGCAINEASARVHWYSPRAQSSPRLWPPDGAGALGLSRELHTRPLLAAAITHVTAGTGLGH